jgi:DNA-binding MarR family transcriptional regulator
MAGPDEIIHQSLRLRIMATLNALPATDMMEFTRLRAILGATDGNLGAHVTTLENAAYIQVEKDFVAKKPRTRVAATAKGRKAFANHLAFLRALMEDPPTSLAAE